MQALRISAILPLLAAFGLSACSSGSPWAAEAPDGILCTRCDGKGSIFESPSAIDRAYGYSSTSRTSCPLCGGTKRMRRDTPTNWQTATAPPIAEPTDYEGFLRRGQDRGIQGFPREAMKDFDRAIALRPDQAPAYIERAGSKKVLRDLQGALTDLDRAAQLDPKNSYVYLSRADAKEQLEDWTGALADYDQYIRMSPDGSAYQYRAKAKVKAKDFNGAIADYDRALQLKPGWYAFFIERGFAKWAAGDKAGAESDWDQARKNAPPGYLHSLELDIKKVRGR